MTSWKCKAQLFLLVILSTIDLSDGGCVDYFKVNTWKDNITQSFSLVETPNHTDIAECTWERDVINGNSKGSRDILQDCFSRKKPNLISEKCQGDTTSTIPFYHLMCLTIKTFYRNNPEAEKEEDEESKYAIWCQYDKVCELFKEEPSTGSTTLPLTTTQPERTTSATTTTTEITSKVTPPPPPPTTTTTATTTSTTTDLVNGVSNSSIGIEKAENIALKIFVVVSAALNVAMLMVILYRHRSNRGLSHKPISEPYSTSTRSPLAPDECSVGNEE